MQLYLFLLVVVSLSCGSLPPTDVPLWRATTATAAMVIAWSLLCLVAARLSARQVRADAIDPLLAAMALEKQLAAFRWLGLGVIVLCLSGFGLARGLDALPLFADSMLLQSLVLLAPGLVMMAATWSAEHHYGVMLGYTDAGSLNHLRWLWGAFRANAAWLIVPVLLLLGLSDAISLLPIERDAAGWLTAMTVIAFVPFVLPWMVRHLFKTTRLSGASEPWVAQLMAAVGLSRTPTARWETGGRTFNAMVVGFVAPLRTLILSDRLLDELPRAQIAMVVLHEAAHLRRRHVPIRMLAVLPAWGAAAIVSRVWEGSDWAMLAGSAVGILLTILMLRIVAYRTEHDADVQACRLAARVASRVEAVPPTYEQACDALAAALLRITFDQPSSQRGTWLHPGVAERIDWMRRQRKPPMASNAKAGTIANPA